MEFACEKHRENKNKSLSIFCLLLTSKQQTKQTKQKSRRGEVERVLKEK